MLQLVEKIGKELGVLAVSGLQREDIRLRKEGKVRTIQSSLAIEGNTLTLEEVSSIVEGKRIVGPKKDVEEVKNAIQVYKDLGKWNGLSKESLLKAHKLLMKGLMEDNGQWRKGGVGVYKGDIVTHVAPPAGMVDELMDDLFRFMKEDDIPWLIKACVFHYELEFIHPFSDGNGRMGRLWQQILLMRDSLVFEYLAVEEIIRKYQKEYYGVLMECDKEANSTKFIEFSLDKILIALEGIPRKIKGTGSHQDRMTEGRSRFSGKWFGRKEYAGFFGISSATASRDLARGLKSKQLIKEGDKATAKYWYQKEI